jgi:hypothetical protein
MKNIFLKRMAGLHRSWGFCTGAAVGAILLSASGLQAAAVLGTVSGGPSSANPASFFGFVDGDTANLAQFHTPWGLALDSSATLLYVADRDNDAIRLMLRRGRRRRCLRAQSWQWQQRLGAPI